MGASAGEWLVRASVWVAILCYPAGVLPLALPPRDRAARTGSRVLWSLGCAAFVVHALASFHFVHGWSHANAWQETARQSAEVTGLRFGHGLYVNYLFAVVWMTDVAWWWFDAGGWSRRPRALDAGLHLFLFLVLFNGSVVFASGFARWLGVGVTVILGIWWGRYLRTMRSPT